MNNDDADSSSSPILLPADDDIILTTTSADSGTFESWTLVTEKQKSKAANINNQTQQQQQSSLSKEEETTTITTTKDLCSRVEVLRNEIPPVNNVEQESNSETLTEMAKEADDFSDGISIISESSESIGRMSPHPLLRQHLHDTLPSLLKETNTYKDAADAMETDDDLDVPNKIKRRKRSLSQQALQATNDTSRHSLVSLLMQFGNNAAVRQGVNLVISAGVVLALCALVGQLRFTEYGTIDGKSLEDVQLKINDLELQNNLMSAEIDLLNKQVNYLTGIYEKTRDFGENNKVNGEKKSGKTFKAWSGNGNKIDPVHINKDDLKRAYKCGMDGKFVEVAGMCVEKKPTIEELETLINDVGSTVNDMLQDGETYKSFEKVAEEFLKNGNKNYDDESMPDPPIIQQFDEKYYMEHDPSMLNIGNNYAENSKEYKKLGKKHRRSHKKTDSDDSFENNDASNESHEHSSHEVHRKRANKERNHGSKERFDDDDDKKQRKSHNSAERNTKKNNKNNKDAMWHENLMLQREELRRQRHKHNDHQNWYIVRGDSREQARSGA